MIERGTVTANLGIQNNNNNNNNMTTKQDTVQNISRSFIPKNRMIIMRNVLPPEIVPCICSQCHHIYLLRICFLGHLLGPKLMVVAYFTNPSGGGMHANESLLNIYTAWLGGEGVGKRRDCIAISGTFSMLYCMACEPLSLGSS